jgi:hypothetical protein
MTKLVLDKKISSGSISNCIWHRPSGADKILKSFMAQEFETLICCCWSIFAEIILKVVRDPRRSKWRPDCTSPFQKRKSSRTKHRRKLFPARVRVVDVDDDFNVLVHDLLVLHFSLSAFEISWMNWSTIWMISAKNK